MTRKYVGKTYTDEAGKFSAGSGVGGKFAEGRPIPEPQKKPSALRELPEIEIKEEGVVSVNLKSEDQAKTLFGSDTGEFAIAMLHQCLNVSGKSGVLLKDGKDALAIVAELAPNDGIEAMLTSQMAAVHIAMMRQSQRMACADTIQELDIYERTFNKLARTFTAQTESLRKHRTGGQQKMTIEHVTVNEGGQAIVGNILREGVSKKMTINPMQSAHDAPRCKAKSKRTQSRCKNPAVRGWCVSDAWCRRWCPSGETERKLSLRS